MTAERQTASAVQSSSASAMSIPIGSDGVEASSSGDAMAWALGVLAETHHNPSAGIADLHLLRDGAKRLAVVALTDGTRLVLKQYADDRGAWTQRWLHQLCDAGFAPPARLAVTPPRGWSRTHLTLATDVAPEYPWTAWVVASPQDRDAAARAAADWLVALQSLDVTLPDRSLYRADDDMTRHCDELGSAFPTLATTIKQVARAAHDQLYTETGRGAGELVLSHGDLHPNNLHIADDAAWSVTAIDMDTAGMRRPAYDVGYAVAQMLIVSWMRTGSFQVGASAGRAFWRRWAEGGAPDADAVGAESARALLQSLHFELITYRNGRHDLLVPWLSVAHSMLHAGVSTTLHALASKEEFES